MTVGGATRSDLKIVPGDSVKIDCAERCGLRVRGLGYERQPRSGDTLVGETSMLRFADEGMAGGMSRKGGGSKAN